MEISITNKGILGVLVAFTLGLGYLSISYFSVSELMGYLFSGLTVLVFTMLLLHINSVLSKQREQERYTPYNPKIKGYNPKPEVPYIPQSQISNQTIGDNSFGNSQYVFQDSNVTIMNPEKKSDNPQVSYSDIDA